MDNANSDVPSPTFNSALSVSTTTNRLDKSGGSTCTGTKDGICYDAAGNQVFDNYTTGAIGGGERTYDAENRMLSAQSGGGSNTSYYTYDADGRRTRRQTPSGTVWQIFGIGGELLAEYSYSGGTATMKKEYGYRNGELLVVWDANEPNGRTLQWLVKDALGSPRMMADVSGRLDDDNTTTGVKEGVFRRDFLPFGEELLAGVGSRATTQGYGTNSDSVRQKFTGQERDAETGLDFFEARYYSGAQGRFTSPDEFTGGPDELFDFACDAADNPTFYANIANPQSLNKYQYCYNNPLTYVDPDGHDPITTSLVVWATGAAATVKAGAVAVGTGLVTVTVAVGSGLKTAAIATADAYTQGAKAVARSYKAGYDLVVNSWQKAGGKSQSQVEWVDENASMSNQARDYQATAAGARSNPATRSPQAPQLEYTDGRGERRAVRFDGVEGNVVIDRKLSVVTTAKARNQALRQSEALRQNGLMGRWEVSSQAEANRATKMFKELGIKNITVKVVEQQ